MKAKLNTNVDEYLDKMFAELEGSDKDFDPKAHTDFQKYRSEITEFIDKDILI